MVYNKYRFQRWSIFALFWANYDEISNKEDAIILYVYILIYACDIVTCDVLFLLVLLLLLTNITHF